MDTAEPLVLEFYGGPRDGAQTVVNADDIPEDYYIPIVEPAAARFVEGELDNPTHFRIYTLHYQRSGDKYVWVGYE